MKTGEIVGFILLGILAVVLSISQFLYMQSPYTVTIPSSGVTLYGLDFEVTWDMFGQKSVTSIEWGCLKPGQTGNVTVYIRNKSLVSVFCAIEANSSTWQPPNAGEFFNLAWDFGELPLGSNRARKTIIFLAVSPDIHDIELFSFDIIITASS